MKVCGYQENKEGTWKLNHSINVWNKFVTANTLAVHCWLGMTTFHCRSSKKNQYFEMGWCPSFGQGRVNFPVVAVTGAAWSRWVHQGCYSTPLTSSPGGRNKGFSLPRRKGVQKVQSVFVSESSAALVELCEHFALFYTLLWLGLLLWLSIVLSHCCFWYFSYVHMKFI